MKLQGRIIHGDGRGRKIGYPTVNFDRRSCRPSAVMHGVWACRVRVGKHAPYRSEASGMGSIKSLKSIKFGGWLKGVAVIGVDNKVEVHILDFNKDIYGWYGEVELVKELRLLKKYKDATLLRAQIKKDIANARSILS